MKLAVIPARGGSKRIPRKNIKHFCGKPMIAWSIEAAKNSGCFDVIMVSTDDEAIAEVARAHGATVPFMRPASLADDYTGTIPVIRHAIQWFVEQGQAPDYVCCVYATAPFLLPKYLQDGMAAFAERDPQVDYAFSVTSYPFPIQRAIRVTEAGRVKMFNAEHFNTRSQDLEEAFHDAGQFYWGRAEAWSKGSMIFGPDSTPVILPRYRVQDIDTPEDWFRAELMFKALQAESGVEVP
tara:strand:+ start:4944 stop:5657 length:714 start_codon:yes stop_codon:yes gene_type:complete